MSYVYQMTYGKKSISEEGLFFPSEDIARDTEFMRFVIPLKTHQPWLGYTGVIASLNNGKFIFPFLWQNEYTELKAFFDIETDENPLISPPTITFVVEDAGGLAVHFSLDIEATAEGKPSIEVIKYIGQHNDIVEPNQGFINLLPVDVRKMDILYLQHRGLFVGRNPNFLPEQ